MVTYYYLNRLARRARVMPAPQLLRTVTADRRRGIVTSLTSRYLPPVLAGIPFPAVHRPDIEWQEAAACRQADPELFFPIGTAGAAAAEIQRAKAICARCPVRRPCLAYALATGQDFGIWGGHDENERRLLHRQWRESRIAASAGPAQPLNPETARS
jgi:WhiB family redox-sensing transcriptional regulator